MTSTHNSAGRLGNQIIRNIAVSLIAKKHDLFVDYNHYEIINNFGIDLFVGEKNYNTMINLNDDNYLSILAKNTLESNVDAKYSFFQTKDITDLVYKYLQNNKQCIIEKNPFESRYNNNNDIFIHIRLTDCEKYNPGINYYLKAISNINFTNLYISTDDANHSIIQYIIEKYPNTIMIDYCEIKTFQFGSTCKYIILSHGSFSALIGYLAFFSTVCYPEYDKDKIWYGDMFSIDGWNKIDSFIE